MLRAIQSPHCDVQKDKLFASIRGSIGERNNVKNLLKAIDEEIESSYKALASTLVTKLSSINLASTKGIRKYIMWMRDIATQLKIIEVKMFKSFLVHYILNSIP